MSKSITLKDLSNEIARNYNHGKKQSYYLYMGDGRQAEDGIMRLLTLVGNLIHEIRVYTKEMEREWPAYDHHKIIVVNEFRFRNTASLYHQYLINWTSDPHEVLTTRRLEKVKKKEIAYRKKHLKNLEEQILFVVGSKPLIQIINSRRIDLPAENRESIVNYLCKRFRSFEIYRTYAIEKPTYEPYTSLNN